MIKAWLFAASIVVVLGWQAGPVAEQRQARLVSVSFTAAPGAMAVLTVAVSDDKAEGGGRRADSRLPPPASRLTPGNPSQEASSLGVWVDGRYEQELLLFPGSGRERYDALLGPFGAGRHEVELRPSAFWPPSEAVRVERADVNLVETASPTYSLLEHAPVLELRADTVGEQTDLPLFAYVENTAQPGGRTLRYTVVFSNEDGGTQTRALFARWGRTTDIEQVYEARLVGDRVVREEFQGPDHETRAFAGRRCGEAPILLVATLNNMVTDRGRGIATVRLVPDLVDLSRATRESTMDARPWACRVMSRELAAEGKIVGAAIVPPDRWMRQAPDPRRHVYSEAKLTLDRALAAAWVREASGRRYWSNYQREGLAIDRDGWVRTAVAVGPDPGSHVAEVGWACVPEVGQQANGRSSSGSCAIEATRAFVLGDTCEPGENLVEPTTLKLSAGEDGRLSLVKR